MKHRCWIQFFVQSVLAFLILTAFSAAYADVLPGNTETSIHPEHVLWDKEPIAFIVPVGTERLISFPGAVSVQNNDPNFTSDKVGILNNAGTLYIRAKKAFPPVRLAITLQSSLQVILVDVSGAPNADDSPVSVLLSDSSASKDTAGQDTGAKRTINDVTLMRYAVQHLYAPRRLVEALPDVHRTPMYTSKSVHLVLTGGILAMPLLSWREGDRYVTAVLLKNTTHHTLPVDFHRLAGNWQDAACYPFSHLSRSGSKHDRTTLFLISDRPFNEALSQMRGYRS